MATRQFTGAVAPGRAVPAVVKNTAGGASSAELLADVLHSLHSSICLLDVISIAFEKSIEKPPEHIGNFAIPLQHGITQIRSAFEQLEDVLGQRSPFAPKRKGTRTRAGRTGAARRSKRSAGHTPRSRRARS